MTAPVAKSKPKAKAKPAAKPKKTTKPAKPKPKAVVVAAKAPTPAKPLGLLVSVRNAEEAKAALAAGADLIDVKEPSKGPLGIAEAEVVADVLKAVGKKVPVSAALGEWNENSLTEAVWHLELPLNYIKWGLSNYKDDPGWGEDLLDGRRQIPARTEVVAVAYADTKRAKSIAPMEIAKFARRYRYKAFLLDTFLKDGKTLLDFIKLPELTELVNFLSSAGVIVALGGSLKFEQLRFLKGVGADFIAVRGGVCVNGRSGELDPIKVKKWKTELKSK